MRVVRGGVAVLTFLCAPGLTGCSMLGTGLGDPSAQAGPGEGPGMLSWIVAAGAFVAALVGIAVIAAVRHHPRTPGAPVELTVPEPHHGAWPADDSGSPSSSTYPYGAMNRPRRDDSQAPRGG